MAWSSLVDSACAWLLITLIVQWERWSAPMGARRRLGCALLTLAAGTFSYRWLHRSESALSRSRAGTVACVVLGCAGFVAYVWISLGLETTPSAPLSPMSYTALLPPFSLATLPLLGAANLERHPALAGAALWQRRLLCLLVCLVLTYQLTVGYTLLVLIGLDATPLVAERGEADPLELPSVSLLRYVDEDVGAQESGRTRRWALRSGAGAGVGAVDARGLGAHGESRSEWRAAFLAQWMPTLRWYLAPSGVLIAIWASITCTDAFPGVAIWHIVVEAWYLAHLLFFPASGARSVRRHRACYLAYAAALDVFLFLYPAAGLTIFELAFMVTDTTSFAASLMLLCELYGRADAGPWVHIALSALLHGFSSMVVLPLLYVAGVGPANDAMFRFGLLFLGFPFQLWCTRGALAAAANDQRQLAFSPVFQLRCVAYSMWLAPVGGFLLQRTVAASPYLCTYSPISLQVATIAFPTAGLLYMLATWSLLVTLPAPDRRKVPA